MMRPQADEELIQIADLWESNQEYLKQQLGFSDHDAFGANWVLMPEVPLPKFNHAGRVRLIEADVDRFLAYCRTFFHGYGVPWSSLLVTPATEPRDMCERLQRLGYHRELNPVMVFAGRELPAVDPAVRVELVGVDQAPLLFYLLQRVFFYSATNESLAAGRRAVDISFRLGGLNYIAYYRGRPAGTGMLFRHGAMGGIYNMATLPEYRGRGVATAILAAAIADAARLGCRYVGLTPTDMGRPLYERVGFRVFYEEEYYATEAF